MEYGGGGALLGSSNLGLRGAIVVLPTGVRGGYVVRKDSRAREILEVRFALDVCGLLLLQCRGALADLTTRALVVLRFSTWPDRRLVRCDSSLLKVTEKLSAAVSLRSERSSGVTSLSIEDLYAVSVEPDESAVCQESIDS